MQVSNVFFERSDIRFERSEFRFDPSKAGLCTDCKPVDKTNYRRMICRDRIEDCTVVVSH